MKLSSDYQDLCKALGYPAFEDYANEESFESIDVEEVCRIAEREERDCLFDANEWAEQVADLERQNFELAVKLRGYEHQLAKLKRLQFWRR